MLAKIVGKYDKWIFLGTYLTCVLFIIMQYLICTNVYMMGGDDYMFGTFGHNGVFAPVFSYYFTGNGRWLINILDSILLCFDRNLYLILTPWLMLLLAYCIYRFIMQLTNTDDIRIFALSVCLISIIDIQMTRETTYWISGSMNYLFPSVLLVSGMTSVLKLRQGNLPNHVIVISTIICLLSCAMVEQYGLMSIGWMLLIWGYDYIKNKRIIKRNVFVFVLSLLLLSIILLAPGNFVRINDASDKGIPIATKILDLVYYDYHSKVSSSFLFIIASLCSYRLYNSRRLFLSVLSLINALILLVCFDYQLINVPFIIVALSISLSLLTFIPALVSVFNRYGVIIIVALAIITIGSQLMLFVSQLWGFRTSMSLIIIYIISILAVIRDTFDGDRRYFATFLICISVNLLLGIVVLVVACLFFLIKKRLLVLNYIFLPLCIIVGLGDEVIGYRANKDTHIKNIQSAESAANNNDIKNICILSYNDEPYGWVSPPFSKWAEDCFRSYYGISDDTSISYTGIAR